MGYIAHDAVVVTVSGYVFQEPRISEVPVPDIDGFRASLPWEWRRLVVGPIRSVVNGDVTFVFAPDGSKEGWGASDEGDEYRSRFMALFDWSYEDGSSPFDVVAVRFGGDYGRECGPQITHSSDLVAAEIVED